MAAEPSLARRQPVGPDLPHTMSRLSHSVSILVLAALPSLASAGGVADASRGATTTGLHQTLEAAAAPTGSAREHRVLRPHADLYAIEVAEHVSEPRVDDVDDVPDTAGVEASRVRVLPCLRSSAHGQRAALERGLLIASNRFARGPPPRDDCRG